MLGMRTACLQGTYSELRQDIGGDGLLLQHLHCDVWVQLGQLVTASRGACSALGDVLSSQEELL